MCTKNKTKTNHISQHTLTKTPNQFHILNFTFFYSMTHSQTIDAKNKI